MAEKSNLGDDAFVVADSVKNPYIGDIDKGVSYDQYEAESLVLQVENGSTVLLPVYRSSARRLVSLIQTNSRRRILDVGCGTGISTLEICLQNPESSVLGIEISQGMTGIAMYKFNQSNISIPSSLTNEKLQEYWENFRRESEPYQNNVSFMRGDIETTDEIESESMNVIIGNQSLHWTDIARSFKQFQRILKPNGEIMFNSASDFCEDNMFPSLEWCFLYNDFIKYVADEVGKRVALKSDYKSLSRPNHDINSFKQIANEAGFQLEQVSTELVVIDLQTVINNHLKPIIRQLCDKSDLEGKDLKKIIKEATAKTITNPRAMNDTKHKYGINPIFRMTKL